MNTARRVRFWPLWFALLIPLAFAVALVGVIWGDNATYQRRWPVI